MAGSFKGKNPLHLAISTGQKEFVLGLLEINEDLAKASDPELGAALHIASSEGYLEIVKLLVEVSPEMSVARDGEGYNPLHIAAMVGELEILEVLLQTRPQAARATVDRGDNILHLCVNHNQLGSLELLLKKIKDEKFVNSTDTSGNNILHLAVSGDHLEIVKSVLKNTNIDVNARNGSGWTARDIHDSQVAKSEDPNSKDRGFTSFLLQAVWVTPAGRLRSLFTQKKDPNSEVGSLKDVLRQAGAQKCDQLLFPFDPSWQKKKKSTLMIVASLMATMAFQVGVNPPGGVWQDNSVGEAGKAIIAYHYPKVYPYLMYFNTVGFLLSFTTIFELIVFLPGKTRYSGSAYSKWVRFGFSWLTIMTMVFVYSYSVSVVTPAHIVEKFKTYGIWITATVWAVVVSVFRLAPYKVRLILLVAVEFLVPFIVLAALFYCLPYLINVLLSPVLLIAVVVLVVVLVVWLKKPADDPVQSPNTANERTVAESATGMAPTTIPDAGGENGSHIV